jgi:hypothetical protein
MTQPSLAIENSGALSPNEQCPRTPPESNAIASLSPRGATDPRVAMGWGENPTGPIFPSAPPARVSSYHSGKCVR